MSDNEYKKLIEKIIDKNSINNLINLIENNLKSFDYELSDADLENIKNHFKEINKEDKKSGRSNDRLTLISESLRGVEKIESSDKFKENIKKIIECVDELIDSGSNSKISDSYGEKEQTELFAASLEEKTKEAKHVVENTEIKIEDYSKRMEKLESSLNSLLISLVSILGIFVAIAFAGFGGITLIGNALELTALDNFSRENIWKILFICLVLGFILFNIFFLLMYFISKICDKSIAMNCSYVEDNDHCFKCKRIEKLNSQDDRNKNKIKRSKIICKLKNKFGYFLWTNIVLCVLMIIIIILFIFDK